MKKIKYYLVPMGLILVVLALGATDYLVKADTQFTEVISKIKNHLQ